MAAGNIPLTLLIAWNRSLQRLGLKQVCSDNEVATLALQMKLEFERAEGSNTVWLVRKTQRHNGTETQRNPAL
jgi:hypothetical protein